MRFTSCIFAFCLSFLIQLPSKADDYRRDYNWNDPYWHEHHYGYWQGHRGYWRYHHRHHEFIQVGPVTIVH